MSKPFLLVTLTFAGLLSLSAQERVRPIKTLLLKRGCVGAICYKSCCGQFLSTDSIPSVEVTEKDILEKYTECPMGRLYHFIKDKEEFCLFVSIANQDKLKKIPRTILGVFSSAGYYFPRIHSITAFEFGRYWPLNQRPGNHLYFGASLGLGLRDFQNISTIIQVSLNQPLSNKLAVFFSAGRDFDNLFDRQSTSSFFTGAGLKFFIL